MNFEDPYFKIENLLQQAVTALNELKRQDSVIASHNAIRSDMFKLRLQDQEAFTLKEAELISKISVKTLYKYRDKGELKVKMGENMKEIILKDDLINFLQSLPYFKV